MPRNDRRARAIEHFVRSWRSGERSAAAFAATFFAPDVQLAVGGETFSGADAVAERIGGLWAMTAVYAQGEWTRPQIAGNEGTVGATFPHLASPASVTLRFRFDDAGRVLHVEEQIAAAPARKLTTIPDDVRWAINGALAAGTPMTFAHVDDDGSPALSLRGSVQVYDDTTLCLWVRNPASGIVRAIRAGRPVSLLYRYSPKRFTLVIRGRGEVVADPQLRDEIFEIVPEVEKYHVPQRTGEAILVHVDRINGNTPSGPLSIAPER